MTDRIIWVDVETDRLDERTGVLLEVAVLVTEADLTPVDEGVSVTIHVPDSQMAGMSTTVRDMHTRNGLLEDVRRSPLRLPECQVLVLDYVAQHVPKFDRKSKTGAPLGGSNIKFDRRWINRHMPRFAEYPHYRDICVSTLKETVSRYFPEVHASAPRKNYAHRAMDDVHESIAEYHSYLSGLGASLPPLAVDMNTGRLMSPAVE